MQYNVSYRNKDKGIQVIVQYKDSDGKWRQKSKQGFKTKKLAKIEADKIIDELKEIVKYDSEFSKNSFGEFKELYLDHIKLYKEFNTYVSISNAFRRFPLDSIIINELGALDIQKCVSDMVRDNLSQNTIKRYLEAIKTFFNWVEIQFNINVPSLKRLTIPIDKKVSTKKALTNSQVDYLISIYKENIDTGLNYYLTILLSTKAGMRAGEICGLTWNDIDFKNNTININKQWKRIKDGSYGFGTLKSKNSFRVIPMGKFLREELLYIKNNYPINIDNRLISLKATVTLTVNLNKKLKDVYDISVHELRHTFATTLIASGLDFKTAAMILGHNVEETMNTYSHVTNDMIDKATKLMNNIF